MNKIIDIIRDNSGNIIIMNNLAILSLFNNQLDKCYDRLKLILDKEQMNSYNDVTYANISVLSDIVHLNKNKFN